MKISQLKQKTQYILQIDTTEELISEKENKMKLIADAEGLKRESDNK